MILSCSSSKDKEEKLPFGKEELFSEVAENVDIYYSENGRVQLRIQGPLMVRSSHQGKATDAFPEGLQVTFFDNEANAKSWLSAKKGTRYPQDRKIVLQDSVVFYNTEQEELRTSELIWWESDGSMETAKFVEIKRPGERIRGFGFKAKDNLTRFEMNAVTGRIKAGDLTEDF